MIGFDEAGAIIAALAKPLGSEAVEIGAAHGRTVAIPVAAAIDSPPRTISAMDGYAVRRADLANPPVTLPVVQEIFAGSDATRPLEAGTCARIFTGAPVPLGADCVVIQEHVQREGSLATFTRVSAGGADHLRRRASDFAAGTVLVEAGTRLGARDLVTVAGGDCGQIDCWRRPKLAIIATGEELASPGCARLRPGLIPDSASVGVAAIAADFDADLVASDRCHDQLADLISVAGRMLGLADLVVVIGGASVGEKDFAKQMFEPHGLQLHFSKVSMKPGKPVWLGKCGEKLVLGLPGNPVSAMVTARLLLAPLLLGLQGRDPASALAWSDVALAETIAPQGDRETFMRAMVDGGRLRMVANQDSGAQGKLAASDWLVRVPPGSPGFVPGQLIKALPF